MGLAGLHPPRARAATTSPGRAGVAAASTWAARSAGGYDTCGVKTDGTAWCWGNNADGQAGDGTRTSRNTSTQVGTASNWAAVAAAGGLLNYAYGHPPEHGYACGVKTD